MACVTARSRTPLGIPRRYMHSRGHCMRPPHSLLHAYMQRCMYAYKTMYGPTGGWVAQCICSEQRVHSSAQHVGAHPGHDLPGLSCCTHSHLRRSATCTTSSCSAIATRSTTPALNFTFRAALASLYLCTGLEALRA